MSRSQTDSTLPAVAHAPAALGAVIAGGRSSRYGRTKALAEIGEKRLVDRVVDAIARVTPDVVLIANDPELAAATGLPWRSDTVEGLGALGGIYAALQWAKELGRPGVLAVACDMPFLNTDLLAHIVEVANTATPAPDLVAPESGGRRGIEPLCAFYRIDCLPAIERAIARDDRRMIGFHDDVRVTRVSEQTVRQFADPARTFFNVNTTADRDTAELLLADASRLAQHRGG